MGGETGGAGGGRNSLPKMSMPRFEGDHPRIWKDQSMDYFCIFDINPALWITTSTLHLDGRAAQWWQAYKLTHEITTWPQFIAVVEANFGVDDFRKLMKTLLHLKQSGTVEEYCKYLSRWCMLFLHSIHTMMSPYLSRISSRG
jgi:hypothetical protein